MKVLTGLYYLPPLDWLLLCQAAEVVIDCSEPFTKQSYKNRAVIMTANGGLNLIVPVLHTDERSGTASTRISYRTPWQRTHRYAIESAYANTPFFEYYWESFKAIIDAGHETLGDLNTAMLQQVWKSLRLPIPFPAMASLEPGPDILDLREQFHPKESRIKKAEGISLAFQRRIFFQPFEYKFGFTSGLSLLDALFCLGPDILSAGEARLQVV